MKEHPCCYYQCPEEGTIHIGVNGGDSHWICFRHLEKWNADRDRFLADGGCKMQRLGELLCDECASNFHMTITPFYKKGCQDKYVSHDGKIPGKWSCHPAPVM